MGTPVNHDIRGQSLARGVIRGSIPVRGRFMDGKSVTEIDGNLQWQTFLPDANPEEGKMDVYMSLFVNGPDVGRRPNGRLRIDGATVSRLSAQDADAGREVLGMLMESSDMSDRFDVQPVQRR